MSLRTLAAALALLLAACQSKEDKLKAAQESGKQLAEEKARMVQGIGEGLKNEGQGAAQAVSEGFGQLVKGVGAGVEKGLLQVKVGVQADLANKGLGVTRATLGEQGAANHAVSLYVTLDKPLDAALELRSYDAEDREVGRATVSMKEAAPTAKYVDFAFDPRTPLLTAKRFELRESPKP